MRSGAAPTAHRSIAIGDGLAVAHPVVVKGVDEVAGVVEGLGPRAHVPAVLVQTQPQRHVSLGARVESMQKEDDGLWWSGASVGSPGVDDDVEAEAAREVLHRSLRRAVAQQAFRRCHARRLGTKRTEGKRAVAAGG